MILKSPNSELRIPDDMTTRHIGKPRFSTLVATLLRFPRVMKPRQIIEMPRATKPDSSQNEGQQRANHFLKNPDSETMRKMPRALITK